MMKKLFAAVLVCSVASGLFAGDLYVQAKGGKNKNPGTKEAPLRNLWKAIEIAKPGDVVHIAQGTYYGKMTCGWIKLDKPLTLKGGYAPGFASRDPMKYQTLLQPTNKQNATKPTFGTLTIDVRKFGKDAVTIIDGILFDHTLANSYHVREGKPEGFD